MASPAAAEQLLLVVYDELRNLAGARLAREQPGQTLQATALVHEAYVRLVHRPQPQSWQSRGHFFAAAAEAMRRILIERARQRRQLKRGGCGRRVPLLDEQLAVDPVDCDALLALDEVLELFAGHAPDKARLVKLRYFAGLSEVEAAEVLGISRATAARWWAYAKAWLFDRLQTSDP